MILTDLKETSPAFQQLTSGIKANGGIFKQKEKMFNMNINF